MSDNARLDRLERRIAALERRLDELEFLPAPGPPDRRRPAPAPRDQPPDPPQAREFLAIPRPRRRTDSCL
jgi:hypothetical protein